jgi:hypothetical protein
MTISVDARRSPGVAPCGSAFGCSTERLPRRLVACPFWKFSQHTLFAEDPTLQAKAGVCETNPRDDMKYLTKIYWSEEDEAYVAEVSVSS